MKKVRQLAPITSEQKPTRLGMKDVAEAANLISMSVALTAYREGKAHETLRRQEYDLAVFTEYLTAAPPDGCGLSVGDLYTDLSSWEGCDFGLVAGFKRWMVQHGYSVGTVNLRLATVKRYCQLATSAGYIAPQSLAMIKEVKGYTSKEGRNVDERRETTRVGKKKPLWTHIDYEQAEALKHLDNPRDALLMCLLLDHGLRVGEVSALTLDCFDLVGGLLVFYRRKVDKTQTHRLTPDTLDAARAYIEKTGSREKLFIAEGENALTVRPDTIYGSERDWVTRAINMHVGVLGRRVGIENLSPHDCRHYWATRATKLGTQIKNLQQAGGWNSPYMPIRYAEDNAIANEGVIL